MTKDFVGNELKVGQVVLFHPKGLASVQDHLAIGIISAINPKTVMVEYECEHIVQGDRPWGRRTVGTKAYPRKFNQVHVIGTGTST